MHLRIVCRLFLLIALLSSLISCSSEPVAVKVGETLDIDGKQLTIETIEQRKILVNDDKQSVSIAPEGKHYLYCRIHNPDDKMIFIKAFKGDEKLDQEDLPYDFTKEIGSGYEEAIYLVNDGDKIQFSLKTPGDMIYNITDTDFPNKDDRQIMPKMQELMAKYADGTHLLTPLKDFIAVDNVYEIAKDRGSELTSSPLVKGMEITYLSKDGMTYQTKSNFLGADLYSDIQWKGDHIVAFSFQLP